MKKIYLILITFLVFLIGGMIFVAKSQKTQQQKQDSKNVPAKKISH